MEENIREGKFGAIVYYDDMPYPVEAVVSYNEKEAESIHKAIAEYGTDDEEGPTLYDLAPSLGMQLRSAFIEQCPDDFLYNAEMLSFECLTFPEEFKK